MAPSKRRKPKQRDDDYTTDQVVHGSPNKAKGNTTHGHIEPQPGQPAGHPVITNEHFTNEPEAGV
jgi:hypothetical protein